MQIAYIKRIEVEISTSWSVEPFNLLFRCEICVSFFYYLDFWVELGKQMLLIRHHRSKSAKERKQALEWMRDLNKPVIRQDKNVEQMNKYYNLIKIKCMLRLKRTQASKAHNIYYMPRAIISYIISLNWNNSRVLGDLWMRSVRGISFERVSRFAEIYGVTVPPLRAGRMGLK